MRFFKFLLVIPFFLVLFGCSTPEQKAEKRRKSIEGKVYLFEKMPELYVCGKYYNFEYFTGNKEWIYDTDITAAKIVMEQRQIKCEKYYGELLSLNSRNGSYYLEQKRRREREDELEEKIESNERKIRALKSEQEQIELKRQMDEASKKIRRY